ncbi:hypothetical protein H6P81_014752 [Aristolochia fimbriata]|uniref:Uncharacterized protein n=1 Tax=Aristolochia fimbriata TaxID=158543 RepID=A0AAV7E7E9_ARIFI|nr:hypothetical protein H6P81_014752 [Aristolochia fimbriata]
MERQEYCEAALDLSTMRNLQRLTHGQVAADHSENLDAHEPHVHRPDQLLPIPSPPDRQVLENATKLDHYYDVIKHPMVHHNSRMKLQQRKYETVEPFEQQLQAQSETAKRTHEQRQEEERQMRAKGPVLTHQTPEAPNALDRPFPATDHCQRSTAAENPTTLQYH